MNTKPQSEAAKHGIALPVVLDKRGEGRHMTIYVDDAQGDLVAKVYDHTEAEFIRNAIKSHNDLLAACALALPHIRTTTDRMIILKAISKGQP